MATSSKAGVRSKRRCRGKGEGSVFQRKGRGAYYIQWVDERGETRCVSSKSRDYAVAREILARETKRVDRIKNGYISPSEERLREGMSTDIAIHLNAYMKHCAVNGHSERGMLQKQRHLTQWCETQGIRTLRDCTAQSLERFLSHRERTRAGRGGKNTGARVWNHIRSQAVAFMNWCCRNEFADRNPLVAVGVRDEVSDARRKRRALTNDEVKRLLAVARQRGRLAWYLLALNCGLRKSDLQRLDWANITFRTEGGGDISFPIQKANRDDIVPMGREVGEVLHRRWLESGSPSAGRVFATTVTDRTRERDFERAGIPVRRADGRVVDLHACRTTLSMRLIRSNASVVCITKIMRHKSLKTTFNHYTDVVADDLRESLEKAVAIG